MKDFILDIHTHTIASGHAYGTIREMAQAARDKDIKLLGLTEHAPGIPGTCDPFYYFNLKVIPRELYGVKIFHGSEVNVLEDGTLSLGQEYIDCLDYLIAGIHRPCYEDQGIEKNTDNLISCMKHPKVYFVSHPDDNHTPLNYDRLVKAAQEYHVALEVNNSSLVKEEKRWGCVENYHKMLRLCMEMHVPIFVGSDAHDPSWVGEFSLAQKLLKEIDFPDELIINNDTEKFERFINYKKI